MSWVDSVASALGFALSMYLCSAAVNEEPDYEKEIPPIYDRPMQEDFSMPRNSYYVQKWSSAAQRLNTIEDVIDNSFSMADAFDINEHMIADYLPTRQEEYDEWTIL